MFSEALAPVHTKLQAVKANVAVLNKNMVEMESRLNNLTDERFATVEQNVQTQLAAHRKAVSFSYSPTIFVRAKKEGATYPVIAPSIE